MDRTFEFCANLVEFKIPETVTVIGPHAFGGCTSLKRILFNNIITKIGIYAMMDCPLKEVVLPASMKSIESWAFACCDNLDTLTIGTDVYNVIAVDGYLLIKDGKQIVENGTILQTCTCIQRDMVRCIKYIYKENGVWATDKSPMNVVIRNRIKQRKSRTLEYYKSITTDSVMTKDDAIAAYRTITNACIPGICEFVYNMKTDQETFTVRELLDLTYGYCGYEKFSEFIYTNTYVKKYGRLPWKVPLDYIQK